MTFAALRAARFDASFSPESFEMNHKRKKSRAQTRHGKPHWFHATPAYWHIIYHRRPRRRHNKALLNQVLSGEDPDSLAWPLGNCRPHLPYW